MLNEFQKRVKFAAHYAAQKIIMDLVCDGSERYYASERKRVLDLLDESDFARYLINESKDFIEPYSVVNIGDPESWRSYAKYSVSEIEAFLESIGDDTSAIDYMNERLNYTGSTNPGGSFNNGSFCKLSGSGNRIISCSSGGIDI